MAQCDMGYEHDEPAVIETPAEPAVVIDPGPNENDVKIAEIEAAARVESEKLWTEQRALELESEVSSLRGELRGIRDTLDRLAPPEPEPDPVVIPAPEPVAEPVPAPPETGKKTAKKSGGGWWDGYASSR